MKKESLVPSRWMKAGMVIILLNSYPTMADPSLSPMPNLSSAPTGGGTMSQFQDNFGGTPEAMGAGLKGAVAGATDKSAFEALPENVRNALNELGKEKTILDHAQDVTKIGKQIDHMNQLVDNSRNKKEKLAKKSFTDLDDLKNTLEKMASFQPQNGSAANTIDPNKQKDSQCREGVDTNQFKNALEAFGKTVQKVAQNWQPGVQKKADKAEAKKPQELAAEKQAMLKNVKEKYKFTQKDMDQITQMAQAIKNPDQLKQILADSRDDLKHKAQKIEEAGVLALLDDREDTKAIKATQQKLGLVVADASNTYSALANAVKDAEDDVYNQNVDVCTQLVNKAEVDGMKVVKGLQLENPYSTQAPQEQQRLKQYTATMRAKCKGQSDPAAQLADSIKKGQSLITSNKENGEMLARNMMTASDDFGRAVNDAASAIKRGPMMICQKVADAIKARDNDPYRKQLMQVADQGYSPKGEQIAQEMEQQQQRNMQITQLMMSSNDGSGGMPGMGMGGMGMGMPGMGMMGMPGMGMGMMPGMGNQSHGSSQGGI